MNIDVNHQHAQARLKRFRALYMLKKYPNHLYIEILDLL